MAKPTLSVRRLFLISTIIGLALASSGCSYFIRFNLKNLSGQTITVSYTVKNIDNGLAPMLVQKNVVENRVKYAPFPDERLKIDIENGTVEFSLLAEEEVLVAQILDGLETDYEQDFNLKTLQIAGEEGSILLEGRQVFRSFRPIKKSWYSFGPETIGFEFEYR